MITQIKALYTSKRFAKQKHKNGANFYKRFVLLNDI